MQKCKNNVDWRQMNLIVSPVAERWKKCGVDWKMESMGERFGWMSCANDSQKPQLSVPDMFGIVRHEHELQRLGLQKPRLLYLSCTNPAFLLHCMLYSGARWMYYSAPSSKEPSGYFQFFVSVGCGDNRQLLTSSKTHCQLSGVWMHMLISLYLQMHLVFLKCKVFNFNTRQMRAHVITFHIHGIQPLYRCRWPQG